MIETFWLYSRKSNSWMDPSIIHVGFFNFPPHFNAFNLARIKLSSSSTSDLYKLVTYIHLVIDSIGKMAIDDSFVKPGAIPFKWEIRPGVPKIQQQPPPSPPPPQKPKQPLKPLQSLKQPPPPLSAPLSPFISQHSLPKQPLPVQKLPKQPLLVQNLKPPPLGSYALLSPEPRTRSFRSAPRSRSDRWWSDQPARVRPESATPGCFPSPLLKRRESKRRVQNLEPDYTLDLEKVSRWSVSSRRSVSPFYGSPASSFSSYRPSPQRLSDAEWAGFGLF